MGYDADDAKPSLAIPGSGIAIGAAAGRGLVWKSPNWAFRGICAFMAPWSTMRLCERYIPVVVGLVAGWRYAGNSSMTCSGVRDDATSAPALLLPIVLRACPAGGRGAGIAAGRNDRDLAGPVAGQ